MGSVNQKVVLVTGAAGGWIEGCFQWRELRRCRALWSERALPIAVQELHCAVSGAFLIVALLSDLHSAFCGLKADNSSADGLRWRTPFREGGQIKGGREVRPL